MDLADTTIAGRAERQASQYQGDAETLKRQIDTFVQYEGYRKKNSIGDKTLVYGGIILSTVVPLSVVFETPVVGAVLGAIVAVMIAVQSAQALDLVRNRERPRVFNHPEGVLNTENERSRKPATRTRDGGRSAQSLGWDLEKFK